MPAPTILFQPPNRVGLGHLSRLIAIALAVKAARPEIRVPFVVGGSSDHGLLEAHGLPYFCLPDYQALDEGAAWESWPATDRRQLALELASAMIGLLRPDLIVFDCLAHPAMLQAAYRHEIPGAICLRTMKDMSRHYTQIRQYGAQVQVILIPHAEADCDVPADLRARTCFTGLITRPLPSRPADHSRAGDSKLVVISGGGGGHPGIETFYNLALDAFSHARRRIPGLDGVLVTGPLFREWWQLRMVDGLRVMPFDEQLSSTLLRADLAICQAGYNTIAELRALDVPAVCVPASRAWDDQFARASQVQSDRLRTYTGTDPDRLAQLIVEMLSTTHPPRAEPSGVIVPSGAAVAADALLGVLEGLGAAAGVVALPQAEHAG